MVRLSDRHVIRYMSRHTVITMARAACALTTYNPLSVSVLHHRTWLMLCAYGFIHIDQYMS